MILQEFRPFTANEFTTTLQLSCKMLRVSQPHETTQTQVIEMCNQGFINNLSEHEQILS